MSDTATTGRVVWVLTAAVAMTAVFAALTMRRYGNRR